MVSVVIPLYNMAHYINRAINSVLSQTTPDFEIIVIDDGSSDDGGKLVQGINDSRIRYIRQENQGVSAARNHGIAEARGELIAFLDADDFWKPRFLEEIDNLRKQFPQAGAYATALESQSRRGVFPPDFNILPRGQKTGLINFFKVIKYRPIWPSAVAVPKKVLEEIGGFPVGEFILEDLDTWLRIALRYPIAWSNQVLSTLYELDWFEKNPKRFKKITRQPRVVQTAREAIASGAVAQKDLPYLQESAAIILLYQARFLLMYGNKDLAHSFIESATKEFHASSASRLLRLAAALPGNLWYGKLIHIWIEFKRKMLQSGFMRKFIIPLYQNKDNIMIIL